MKGGGGKEVFADNTFNNHKLEKDFIDLKINQFVHGCFIFIDSCEPTIKRKIRFRASFFLRSFTDLFPQEFPKLVFSLYCHDYLLRLIL